jgi:hypothetical protein
MLQIMALLASRDLYLRESHSRAAYVAKEMTILPLLSIEEFIAKLTKPSQVLRALSACNIRLFIYRGNCRNLILISKVAVGYGCSPDDFMEIKLLFCLEE